MESSILKWFRKILRILNIWFNASKFGKCFNRISACFAKAFPDSFLGRFFHSKPKNYFRESLFYKFLLLPITVCRWIAIKFSPFFTKISQNSQIHVFFSNWHLISVRVYGLFLLVFTLTYSLLRSVISFPTPLQRIILACLFLVGAVMFLVNRSIKSLFKGSFIFTAIGGLFCEIKKDSDSKLFLADTDLIVARSSVLCISALLLGILTALFPIELIILLFAGLLFLYYAFTCTTFCVYCVIIAAPFLPTMVLTGLCILSVVSFLLQILSGKLVKLRPIPMGAAVAFFMLTMVLGAITSFTFIKSLKIVMIYMAFMLFFFVSYQTLDTKKKWQGALVAFLLMSAFVALYGIFQNFAGVSSTASWVDKEMFNQIKTRVYSTFDNPNVLGEYLVIMIPITLAVMKSIKTDGQRLLYSLIFLALAMCMVFTWSRGAWLGVMLASALFLFISDKRWALLAILGVFMLPFLLGSGSAIAERILSIGNTKDTSTAYRVSIWHASINMIRDFWIGGIGSGSDAFSMIYPKYALAGANFALHSHNLFLQIMVELGITGFIAFFWMILTFIRQCFSLAIYSKRSTLSNAVVISLCCGMLGFLFQGLTDNVWYNYKMVLIFWIVLSLASIAANDFNGGEEQ